MTTPKQNKEIKIKFIKLFEKLEEGMIPLALISYQKQEWELGIEDYHLGIEDYQEVVYTYRHSLWINLWFIIIYFNWIKKTI